MVQLRSCYFCGTTGALSEYEALPPELGVVSEASPRVILCDRCQTKLTNVLAPLVDSVDRGEAAVGVRPDVATGHSSSTDSTPTGGGDPAEEVGSDAPDADEQPSQPEVTFAHTETPAAEDTDDAADSDTDSATSSGGAGDSTGGDSETDAGGEDGDETREDGDDTTGETGEDEPPDASDAGSVAVDETPTESAEETDAGRSAADLDRVYHKLLRFLRNREFPIPRTEAEAIAQSAYDLTATEASQVIQRTIDRDVLEERDGELHRR